MRFLGYWPADFIFSLGVVLMFAALWYLHLSGKINLIDCITSTDKQGGIRTDPRKLIEFCTWYALTLTLVYIVVQDKLTEYFILAYIGGATTARFLRDREQRLNNVASRKSDEG